MLELDRSANVSDDRFHLVGPRWLSGILKVERDDYLPKDSLAQHEIHVPKQNTFALLMEHFADCVRAKREPITSGRSQRRPLEAVLAAYESMASGRPVILAGA